MKKIIIGLIIILFLCSGQVFAAQDNQKILNEIFILFKKIEILQKQLEEIKQIKQNNKIEITDKIIKKQKIIIQKSCRSCLFIYTVSD